jgi:hypothetical protein
VYMSAVPVPPSGTVVCKLIKQQCERAHIQYRPLCNLFDFC